MYPLIYFAWLFLSSNTFALPLGGTPAWVYQDSIRLPLDYHFRYELEKPDTAFEMPGRLEEISGLGISPDGKNLVAVNDEKGKLYFLDKETGKVVKEVEFWKNGDYEGIEMIGNTVFVVKSTGTIYEIKNVATGASETQKYNSFLNRDNNVEGLGYDQKSNCLLLGCKGKAGEGKKFSLEKAIYSFDPVTKEFDEAPAYVFSLQDVDDYLKTCRLEKGIQKLWEFFDPDKSEMDFSPSAIAVHPISGEIYILSSVGKMLLVLSRKGEILYIEKLKKKLHRQPEGLCFDADGTMYISNEGKGEKGKIYRFGYQ